MADEIKAIHVQANVEDGVLHVNLKVDILDLLDDLAKGSPIAQKVVGFINSVRGNLDWEGIKKQYS